MVSLVIPNNYCNTLIERKPRMPQIRGIQGRSRSILLRALGNEDAVGVKPKAVGYYRLSRRVNKMGFLSKLYISLIEAL